MDICETAAAPKEHPESGVPGLEEEDLPILFKPLLSSPRVPLEMDNGGLDLSDIEGLDPQILEKIPEKAMAKAKKNRKMQ